LEQWCHLYVRPNTLCCSEIRITKAKWRHFHGLTAYPMSVSEHCYQKLYPLKTENNRLYRVTRFFSSFMLHATHLIPLLPPWLLNSKQLTNQRCGIHPFGMQKKLVMHFLPRSKLQSGCPFWLLATVVLLHHLSWVQSLNLIQMATR
jgi:hypothetical protein